MVFSRRVCNSIAASVLIIGIGLGVVAGVAAIRQAAVERAAEDEAYAFRLLSGGQLNTGRAREYLRNAADNWRIAGEIKKVEKALALAQKNHLDVFDQFEDVVLPQDAESTKLAENETRRASLDVASHAARESNRRAALFDEQEAIKLLAGNWAKNDPAAVWRGTHKKMTADEFLDAPESSVEWIILPDDGSYERECLQKARQRLQSAATKWYLDGNRARAKAIEAILPNLTILGPEKAKNSTVDNLITATP